MNGSIARAVVRGIMHIAIDSCILNLGGRVFEVSIVHEAVIKLFRQPSSPNTPTDNLAYAKLYLPKFKNL